MASKLVRGLAPLVLLNKLGPLGWAELAVWAVVQQLRSFDLRRCWTGLICWDILICTDQRGQWSVWV